MIAVIDVGSNSVRLLVRDKYKTIFKNNIITKLALNKSGNLLDSGSIKRTADAVVFFVNKAKEFNADKIFAFGTEALRSAENCFEFTNLVLSLTGINVEIISGEKEAKLGLLGVLQSNKGGIIDIGGASTEIIVSNGKKIEYSKSLHVGVVSLDNAYKQDANLIKTFSRKKVLEYGIIPKSKMYGIGGTITSVASMLQELKEYDSKLITGYVLKKQLLEELIKKVSNLSIKERENIIGLQPKRASTILGGMIWLDEIMNYLGAFEVVVSDMDNLEGYLIEKGLYE